MQSNYRGLAFLLSIGSLPLACTKDTNDTDGDDSTTTASTTPNGTTGTGTDATDPTQASNPTSTSGTTTGMTDPPTATSEPQPTTFVTSDSETADTGFGTDTDLPPATDPTCIAYAAHMVECFPRYAGYQEYFAKDCEYTKMYSMTDGPPCTEAVDAFYVCLSMAACAELVPEDVSACPKELAAAQAACPSFDDDTDTDAGGTDSTSG